MSMRILFWNCALLATAFLFACDDGGETANTADMNLAGVCNPPCSPGFTCSQDRICEPDAPGMGGEDGGMGCSDSCQPDDEPRCQGNAYEECRIGASGCLEWSEPVPCENGLTCSNGACSSTCEDECVEGDQQCGDLGPQFCITDDDPDPCTEWGPQTPCEDGESCNGGVCTAGPCVDDCGMGAVECAPDGFGIRECGNFDGDECLEWRTMPCADGETCSAGQCSEMCTNECAMGEQTCGENGRVALECGNFDGDDCLDWGNRTRCAADEICLEGACQSRDACNGGGECVLDDRRCSPNGFQQCVETDGCLVWGPVQACPDGEGCNNGACEANAGDECPAMGATACDGNSVIECGDWDIDPALEWSMGVPCEAGTACNGGRCTDVDECIDECAEDAVRCNGGRVERCGNFDADNCREFGDGQPCPGEQVCSNGQCGDMCQSECEIGQVDCQGNSVISCGQFDMDPCNDWAVPLPCAQGQMCLAGQCRDMEMMGGPNDNAVLRFVRPGEGTVVTGVQQVTLQARDPDGIAEVVIFAGERELHRGDGGGVVALEWDTTTAHNGELTLTATLTDVFQRVAELSREVIVDNGGPVVEILSPNDGEVLRNPFDFRVEAEDAGGVRSVRFMVDGQEAASLNAAPWTTRINPADYPPLGPKALEVIATDNGGEVTRTSVNVEFDRPELEVTPVTPMPGDIIAEPFVFEVNAQGPNGVAAVTFSIDGEPVGRAVVAAPYRVDVDPADYATGEHQLTATAEDADGNETVFTMGLAWDSEVPEVELISPERGGLVTREGDVFTLELAVDDADSSPIVEVFFGDQRAGVREAPPYEMEIRTDVFESDTHEQEIQVRIVATDYIGNERTIEAPLRFSRADWSVRIEAAEESILRLDESGERALMAVFDRARQNGRLYAVGPAGSGAAIWDAVIPGGRPMEAMFYPDGASAGAVVELGVGGVEFMRFDNGEMVWRSNDGIVTDALINEDGVTYIMASRRNVGRLVGRNLAGTVLFEFDPQGESVDWVDLLPDGDVLVRTIAQGGANHQYRRITSEGEVRWTYDVGSNVTRNGVHSGNIVAARFLGEGMFADQVEVVSIGADDGRRSWGTNMPPDKLPQQFGFRADGNPFFVNNDLHVATTAMLTYDVDTGNLLYDYTAPGFTLGEAISIRRGEMAISGNNDNQNVGAVFRVSANGQNMAGFRTDGETVSDIASYDSTVAAAVVEPNAGAAGVVMLDPAGDEVWRTALRPGLVINRLEMHAALTADVFAEDAATRRGVVLPLGPDGALSWRVEREGGNVSSFGGSLGQMFVILIDEDGVDLVRLPRE